MFTLQREPNPLEAFAAGAGQRIAQNEQRAATDRRREASVQKALQGLNETSSPLEWYRSISAAPEDVQGVLWKGYENVQRRANEEKKSEQEASTFSQDFEFAKSQGMDESLADAYARGTQKEKGLIRAEWLKDKERSIEEEEPLDLPGSDQEEDRILSEESPEVKRKSGVKLTPVEQIRRESDRFRLQTPIYTKIKDELSGSLKEATNLKILDEINGGDKLPEGLERLNIDWSNGDIRVPALANPETQRFAKTLADFLSSAKAIFGARITNYDLDSFKKRLPSLANTKEGRSIIIKQMQILNEAAQAENKSILDAFDHNGGIRKIDYDQAAKIADKKMKGQREKYQERLKTLDGRALMLDTENINLAKKNLRPGYILMMKPDGSFTQINEKQASAAEKQSGYRKL